MINDFSHESARICTNFLDWGKVYNLGLFLIDMDKNKRWILLVVIALIAGIYFGVESGSSVMWIRWIVGVVMGALVSWLVSGFLK